MKVVIMKRYLSIIGLNLFLVASSFGNVGEISNDIKRDIILGSIIKNGLESLHFSKKKLDDDLSLRAFQKFIERLDYSKRFLLQSDVDYLSKMERKIDDQINSGNLKLIKESSTVLKNRINLVEGFVATILKKPFDLDKDVELETDPEKRAFAKNEKELMDRWYKILKHEVLNRYVNIEEEQDPSKKDKNEDKKKDKKKKKKKVAKVFKGRKEIEAEARKRTLKSYKNVFKRLLKIDHNDELTRFFNSVTQIYDPHTNYLAPREKKDFDISMKGSLEGIGAILREDGDYIKVVEIIPGSAAWRGKKLEAEDIILKVGQGKKDPIDIVGMRVEEAVEFIRGKKGTEVRLTVKKSDGQISIIPIVRDIVLIEESYVKHSILEFKKDKNKYGYIHVPQFYRDFSKGFNDKTARNCTDDVRKALESLKKSKVNGVILDLRNNGGGSLEDARLMSGLFIDQGPIVQIKASTGGVQVLKDRDGKTFYDGPLIVLVNKFSASASEILAGALQDYGRAVIVGGDHTHGKGTVQTLLDLDRYVNANIGLDQPLGSIKLTVQKFYRVSGGSTQYRGITPDIKLPDPMGHVKTGEKELEYSLPWDKVDPVPFTKWKKKSFNTRKLAKMSSKRVKKSEKFNKIKDIISYLDKRREDTKVKLTYQSYNKDRQEAKKRSEELKFKTENKDIIVTDASFSKKNKELNDDQKRRSEEWIETLQTDPILEETLFILKDMLVKK